VTRALHSPLARFLEGRRRDISGGSRPQWVMPGSAATWPAPPV